MHSVKSFAVGLGLCSLLALVPLASCSSPPEEMTDSGASMPDTSMPACPTGYSQCGADCAPIKRDPLNCGACGKACKAGEVCVQGGCALQCGGSTVKCSGYCVDSKSN